MFFNQSKANNSYRPDIDGIRALAVISVVFYHFKIPGFIGGFTGVDIFFVISGFLITGGIVKTVDNKTFNFNDFCARRVRRLIPALLAVISVTYIASFFILAPKDFSSLSGSIVYALSGMSNIYFWLQSDYFDNFSSMKPLLHTWSLSVELQFYLVWPFVIIWVCKLFVRYINRLLAVMFLTTVLAFISIFYMKIDTSAAFYLTPFRMHEFAVGGIGFFISKIILKHKYNAIIYSLGMMMVLYSIFFFNVEKITFPGYYALLPCIGTILMICYGENVKLSRFFSNKIVSHIGEISYSLYLVHWPVYVLICYVLVFPPEHKHIFIMLVLTIGLTYILYFAVERRFRYIKNSRLNNASFSLVCIIYSFVVIIPSASSWAQNGWEWRLPEQIRSINNIDKQDTIDYTWKEQTILSQKKSFSLNDVRPKILVIGDSQSADLINIMYESGYVTKNDVVARTIYYDCGVNYVSEKKYDEYFHKVNALTVAKPELIPKCKILMKKAMSTNLLVNADKIFVAFHYQENTLDYFIEGVEKLKEITNAKIYVIGRKNLTKSSVDIVNTINRIVGLESYASKFKDDDTYVINKKLSLIKDIEFIDMMSYVCPEDNRCHVITEQNKPIFYDPAHFTKYGAEYFSGRIKL
ncbi:acyltransferase family protein [Citrobacter farmeri]|nr:acyltransferase [Citrobacter farmeri]